MSPLSLQNKNKHPDSNERPVESERTKLEQQRQQEFARETQEVDYLHSQMDMHQELEQLEVEQETVRSLETLKLQVARTTPEKQQHREELTLSNAPHHQHKKNRLTSDQQLSIAQVTQILQEESQDPRAVQGRLDAYQQVDDFTQMVGQDS